MHVVAESLEPRRFLSAGDLDPSFGTGGKVRVSVSTSDDGIRALTVQQDGRIIAAGFSGQRLALTRHEPGGALDASFGVMGKYISDLPETSAAALGLQPDGKILVAGRALSATTNNDFALFRFLPNGTPDSTFGSGGIIRTDFYGRHDEAVALKVLPDDSIVLGGIVTTFSGTTNFALAKFGPDGQLDGAFGDGGLVSTDFGAGNDWVKEMAVQSDGRIILGGYSFQGSTYYGFSFARYLPNGTLDGSFGTGGKARHDVVPNEQDDLAAFGLQADGRIVATGKFGGTQMVTVRFLSNGARDTSFSTNIITLNGAPISLAVAQDNQILIAGYSAGDFALVRLHGNGAPDTTFGDGGRVLTDFEFSPDYAYAVMIQPDRKIIVGGSTVGFNRDEFAIARYIPGSGSPVMPPVATGEFRYLTAPHKLTFSLSHDVGASLGVDDLVLINVSNGTSPAPGAVTLAYDSATNVATFSFPGLPGGLLPDGRWRATLLASGVSDRYGNRLDGDGDGVPGDDLVYQFFHLTGDANHDARVNLQDFNVMAGNFGRTGGDYSQGDFNYDGVVNLADFNLLAGHFGTVLAPSSTTDAR
jgi:uncharacterized delta-60 repeat protein